MDRRAFLAAAAAATTLPALPAVAMGRSIADIAVATPDLSTLVTALDAAGLVDTFASPGRYTVFAPTNRAFAHLPHGTLKRLLNPHNRDQLTNILTYHVAPGRFPAKTLLGVYGRLETLQGSSILVDGRHGGVVLDHKVNVTTTDIRASNGIIHVIDGVLMPH